MNKRIFRWNLDYCYQNIELGTLEFSGSMLGTEFIWGPKKWNISYSLLLPVSGTSNNDKFTDVSFLSTRLKYCYLFNETFGMSLGYRFDSVGWDRPTVIFGRYTTEWAEITRRGIMLGVTYQF